MFGRSTVRFPGAEFYPLASVVGFPSAGTASTHSVVELRCATAGDATTVPGGRLPSM